MMVVGMMATMMMEGSGKRFAHDAQGKQAYDRKADHAARKNHGCSSEIAN